MEIYIKINYSSRSIFSPVINWTTSTHFLIANEYINYVGWVQKINSRSSDTFFISTSVTVCKNVVDFMWKISSLFHQNRTNFFFCHRCKWRRLAVCIPHDQTRYVSLLSACFFIFFSSYANHQMFIKSLEMLLQKKILILGDSFAHESNWKWKKKEFTTVKTQI